MTQDSNSNFTMPAAAKTDEDVPKWKQAQLRARNRAKQFSVFPPEALRQGNKLKFHGSPTIYTVGPAGNIVRDVQKLSKAERKQAKRHRREDRESAKAALARNAHNREQQAA